VIIKEDALWMIGTNARRQAKKPIIKKIMRKNKKANKRGSILVKIME